MYVYRTTIAVDRQCLTNNDVEMPNYILYYLTVSNV